MDRLPQTEAPDQTQRKKSAGTNQACQWRPQGFRIRAAVHRTEVGKCAIEGAVEPVEFLQRQNAGRDPALPRDTNHPGRGVVSAHADPATFQMKCIFSGSTTKIENRFASPEARRKMMPDRPTLHAAGGCVRPQIVVTICQPVERRTCCHRLCLHFRTGGTKTVTGRKNRVRVGLCRHLRLQEFVGILIETARMPALNPDLAIGAPGPRFDASLAFAATLSK